MTYSVLLASVVVHMVEKKEEGSLKLKLRGKDLKNVEGITGLRLPDPFIELSKPTGGQDEW